jgi:hypothetical protein
MWDRRLAGPFTSGVSHATPDGSTRA